MRKTVGILFALVLAVSLVVPAAALAQDPYAGLDKGAWDKVKWQDNPDSWHLYLQHWGRTPIQAMTRLSGLCGPTGWCNNFFGVNCPRDPNSCLGGCPACRVKEPGALATCDDLVACEKSLCEEAACPATGQGDCYTCPANPVIEGKLATCCCCWGKSLAFANKSWAGCTISTHPRVNDSHLNHFGVSECYGGGKGGDWGLSGCPHTESCSLTWCLQDNLCANPLANK